MGKKPLSWKEYLVPKQHIDKHSWVLVSGSGKALTRSLSGLSSDTSEITLKYKCNKCHITATKLIGENGGDKILDKKELEGLTCEEIIIKNIIE